MKKITALLFLLILMLLAPNVLLVAKTKMNKPEISDVIPVTTIADAKMELASPSAVLIEGSTGTVIFEKNKDEKLRPASVTKVMTLLLIFEALKDGTINLMDDVNVTEHAASMGGSQVYLEPYEVQNVDTLIKCISIASANDASVAMAEHIAGSHEEFVARMNERAKELGMNNTNFVNCTGLDADNHYTTAYDIALMSRELIRNFPQVSNYATVWMDTFVHTTKKGRSEFGLTNTNKLIKSYKGITGLKTGSTSIAKYCLSATAKRNNMDLIAVIMAAPDTKTRFMEASKLLNYGFANYSVYVDDHKDVTLEPVRITKGVSDYVYGNIRGDFSYLCTKGMAAENIRKEVVLLDKVPAPITTNDKIGDIIYYYENEKIGNVDILAKENVDKAGYKNNFNKSLKKYFLSYN
ncbi:MAG: D-alanyl-D-alanine carboxypeptidase [Clostridiales bacterium]|nr:D-alanyl-D-alanine carboxypeptidase [Clostridiales bacterium]